MTPLRILAVALALVAPPAAAQEVSIPVLSSLWNTLSAPDRAAWARPLSSAIVPGIGQLLGGQERGAIYLALEAVFLVRFVTYHGEAQREGNRYRDLAFVVARGAYQPGARDTTFEYFEQMARIAESGPFDIDPGPALVPPTDETTYNGRIWALARQTFLSDPDAPVDPSSPEYQQALAFYLSRAVGPNFEWSWRNAGLEQDLFRQTIRDSDEAFRAATRQLGLLLANHLLSAVDAFVTHRLSGNGRIRMESAVLPGARGSAAGLIRWQVTF